MSLVCKNCAETQHLREKKSKGEGTISLDHD